MSEKEILDKVTKILVDQLDVKPEEVVPDANFLEDLNADSLDIVELILVMEEEFNFQIPDEDAEKIQTVGDAVKYIKEHI
ncbi:acyl carrier protein [Amygdalobacter indicium]|jgi:hypothetical protein|uniref:Acyl carrier protein n=1 Tax=Amygdalobacter indicium TaxID=3029272 RepID=A0ABY8C8G0_9FIRM|nr:acyl carrier protein [Amygdalobacter indicium]WEG33794.1 acyl carrier protein [Amygdalobacter indicium]WEG35370.1 acyl carrier protein [Amygdalobacter indicium]